MGPSQEALTAIRQRMYDEGIPVIDWARAHGFDVHLVYSVLSGRSRAQRGESHRIAVALGLKPVGSRTNFEPGLALSATGEQPRGANDRKEDPMKN